MNSSIQCGLKGAYKVDLYSGAGRTRRWVSSTDWFSNDITNTGLSYPLSFSFAECFRFLSLGSVAVGANKSGYTDVNTPIQSFTVFSGGYGTQTGRYIGWQGYEIGGLHSSDFQGSFASACGTQFTNQGINMYRGWTLPTGGMEDGTVIGEASGLTINSFMVSPTSGGNPSGSGAFSLVDRNIVIPSGFSATITYQLSLIFQNYSGRTFFACTGGSTSTGWFDTGSAYTGVNNSEVALLRGWSNRSGIYRQVLPGLQIVDSIGACIVPYWGDQLEPKNANCTKMYCYLSPDISQFAVSPYGALGISESGAYNSDGLMGNYTQFASVVGADLAVASTAENSWPDNPDTWYNGSSTLNGDATTTAPASMPANIRLENLLNISNYSGGAIPADEFDYQTKGFVSPIVSQQPVAFATPGGLGFNLNSGANYGQRAVYSTYFRRVPTGSSTWTTGIRRRTVTKQAQFSPIQCYGYNSRYGSLVLGYLSTISQQIGDLTFQPYIDFLFMDTSGRAADMPHYRVIPDIYLTERGSGVAKAKFYITGNSGGTSVWPESITRLYGAEAFMGPGVGISAESPTGLDLAHPLLTNEITVDTQIYPSGYVFGGQTLASTVQGDVNYNSSGGWGAVYGVIGSEAFYRSPMDTAAIENRAWSGRVFVGFSGVDGAGSVPNPTGDNAYLIAPYNNTVISGLGVLVTGVEYFLHAYGNIPDPNNFYANGTYQMIDDFRYSGMEIIDSFYHDDDNDAYIFFTKVASPNNITDMLTTADAAGGDVTLHTGVMRTLTNPATGFQFICSTGVNIGQHFTEYVTFAGFTNLSLSGRGSGMAITANDINNMYWSGANTVMLDIANDGAANGSYYLCRYDESTNSFLKMDNTGLFRVYPTQWKKPSGTIRHYETWGGSGCRLLPNYAYPNNRGINSYSPIKGGEFPALSMENSLKVFVDFTWSGD